MFALTGGFLIEKVSKKLTLEKVLILRGTHVFHIYISMPRSKKDTGHNKMSTVCPGQHITLPGQLGPE